MLVLSRTKDGRIFLPDVGVEIQVLDIQRGKVSLGITAPPHVTIVRDDYLPKPTPDHFHEEQTHG